MRKSIQACVAILALLGAFPAHATFKIFATTTDWAALATELGGAKVAVYTATSALQDVHRAEAKPDWAARARAAGLVIANGASLEANWLPALLRESGNVRIQPGSLGYFEAAMQVERLEMPSDPFLGGSHPQGNPHVQLDPRNIAAIAKALTQKLATLDPTDAAFYRERNASFQRRWEAAMTRWQAKGAPLAGLKAVVIHRDQSYLLHWLGMSEAAAIEPKPGVPPSAGYLAELFSRFTFSRPNMILRNAYNDPKAVEWLALRSHLPVVSLPFSVGGTPGAKDLFGLFDDTLERLLAAAK